MLFFFGGRGICANCKQIYCVIRYKIHGKTFCTKHCVSEYFRCAVCKKPSKYFIDSGSFCSKNCERKFLYGIPEDDRSRHIPLVVRREVWQRDKGFCLQCGSKKDLEFDHIIPWSKGGSNSVNNIQILCKKCNSAKRDNI